MSYAFITKLLEIQLSFLKKAPRNLSIARVNKILARLSLNSKERSN